MLDSKYKAEDAPHFGRILRDGNLPLKKRFRALFVLKTIGGPSAVKEIADSFSDPSCLLKHDLAFCLGQIGSPCALPYLEQVLSDESEEVMFRHEAGEAIGAIGSIDSLDIIKRFTSDKMPEVAETCQIAKDRIEWLDSLKRDDSLLSSPYMSRDPAPSLPENAGEDAVQRASDILLDSSVSLFDRYRALFYLRNDGCSSAIEAICKAMACPESALFRHEVAYVLGQLQSPMAIEALVTNLADDTEHYMVRHECAEALGAIGTEKCVEVLTKYLSDPSDVVRESCEVALDIADYDHEDGDKAVID